VSDSNVIKLAQPGAFTDSLTEILRGGARALLTQAVEAEVAGFLAKHADLKTGTGRQRVVRHGHLPEREIMTGIGPVAVRQPRVRDREAGEGERIRYSSSILPRYARRSKSLEVLIPVLYLKGISSGDFEEALAALVGKDAPGLSASTIARLKEAWSEEHGRWQKRDLSAKRYVYWWADGIHLEARLEEQAQCILVIIGATAEGKKELVGFTDGMRESSQSWRDLLLDLKRRGLTTAAQIAVAKPALAKAGGALGFWKALGEIWPTTREQRCWVHKTANILNKLPKSLHTKAKRALQEIWMAETQKDAVKAFEAFVETYQVKYERAADCLTKDRDALLAFYDFPAEHWKHLRTTNPIESTFATVRHRTIRSKGCLSNKTALAMVFKLVEGAQKSWRRIDGHNQLPKLIQGIRFTDGIEVIGNSAVPQAQAAA
jgi:putative transposase